MVIDDDDVVGGGDGGVVFAVAIDRDNVDAIDSICGGGGVVVDSLLRCGRSVRRKNERVADTMFSGGQKNM